MTSVRQTGSLNGFSVDETKNYYYDLNRRLCRLHTLEGGDTVFAYDSAGHLTAYQKGLPAGSACSAPSGTARVALSYDSLGRPTSTDYADAATADISRTYDANGNPLTVHRNGVNWSYAYNELNALTRETLAVDGRSYLCSYAYNTLGQIVSHTLPSGRSLTLTYDGLGRTTSLASGSAVYAQNMAYHPNGALFGFTYGNGQLFTQTLTERQMPWRLRSAQGANTALDLTYSYDARGKITGVVNAALGGDNRSYGYDALGRLTGASGPWGAGSYVYDALGNLRQKTEGSRTVTNSYNANNQVGASAASGLPTRSFGYDARGNVTAIGGLQFGYDYSDQPTVLSGSAAGAYRYDGHFKRVKSTVNGKIIYNVFDASGTLIHIDNVTDHQQTDLVGRVARITNNVVTYLHPDHLGSAQAGTNASGAIAWREQYTPFGETIQRPPANDNQAGYTGHIQDQATGLTYMQARYYDAALGRFLSVDPVDPVESSDYDLNLYAYVGNDPVNRTDPTGLYTCSGNTSDCKQVDNFVSAATKAAGNLDKKSDAYAKVEKVLGYLGKAGDKNGVVLNPTSLAKGTLASASPNGKINVDVGQISSAASKVYGPANPGVSAGDLRNGVGGSVVAHEARHEIDFQKNGFPNSKASEYRTELNAYKTQIGVERGLGITGLSNSQMSEDQLNGAAAAGAQRSVDAWCAAGGSCQ